MATNKWRDYIESNTIRLEGKQKKAHYANQHSDTSFNRDVSDESCGNAAACKVTPHLHSSRSLPFTTIPRGLYCYISPLKKLHSSIRCLSPSLPLSLLASATSRFSFHNLLKRGQATSRPSQPQQLLHPRRKATLAPPTCPLARTFVAKADTDPSGGDINSFSFPTPSATSDTAPW